MIKAKQPPSVFQKDSCCLLANMQLCLSTSAKKNEFTYAKIYELRLFEYEASMTDFQVAIVDLKLGARNGL